MLQEPSPGPGPEAQNPVSSYSRLRLSLRNPFRFTVGLPGLTKIMRFQARAAAKKGGSYKIIFKSISFN